MAQHFARSLLVLGALGLSGCAAFSPDSGMSAVSELTSQTIKKDVAFVRTAEGADCGRRARSPAAVADADRRDRRADRAAQQQGAAGRL